MSDPTLYAILTFDELASRVAEPLVRTSALGDVNAQ
jgi:hypothetical protein